MRYRILNQGIGAVETPLPEDVKDFLVIEIDNADGDIVKLVGHDHVAYKDIKDGTASFDAAELSGRIELSLVRASGIVPLGAFICIITCNGTRIYQDAEDVLTRLAKVERDISDTLAIYHELVAKYRDIGDRLDRLFTGYNF